ncbi:hypothetical protein [Falsiporphyromonas endometrii]|uniref:Rieske domain-containing protein n=1 Tax=Falsiporphyromonas endometrii TaxID=1387297 RepID=A0ABV9K9G0_9PORP|nr:hypothetical protein [Porphyromonadaceae bacterium]
MIGKKITGLILLFIGLLTTGCRQEIYETMPELPVNYTLMWNSPKGLIIQAPGSSVEVSERTKVTDYIGFGGLIIVHTIGATNEYVAFDLSCPLEANRQIKLQPTDNMEYKCPECGSRYSVIYGSGAPTKGPSRIPLKRYKAIRTQEGVYCIN